MLPCPGCKETLSRDETGKGKGKSRVSADFGVPPHSRGFRKQLHMGVTPFRMDRNSLHACSHIFCFLPEVFSNSSMRGTGGDHPAPRCYSTEVCAWTGVGTRKPHQRGKVHKCFPSWLLWTLKGAIDNPTKAPVGDRMERTLVSHDSD